MTEYKRASINTTLKNARIFDEDSMESENELLTDIKKEPLDDDDDDVKNTIYKHNNTHIKLEQLSDSLAKLIKEEVDLQVKLKFETDKSTSDSVDDSNPELTKARQNLKRKITFIKQEHTTENSHSSPKKRLESTSSTISTNSSSPEQKKLKTDDTKKRKRETDPAVLGRRQKQIDYGKNTIGYDKYVESVPKNQREKTDPQTPNKYRSYSRRGWDGLIKQWRLQLHSYDSK